MKAAAFISHYDCSRHDTGWSHPDHQGRLPGLMRAVHADMLTLFDHLLEVEGRHASEEELGLVHSPEYLDGVRSWVEEAATRGETIEAVEGVRVSSATWDAARAGVGSVLTGVDRLLAGDARTAFCAVRPAGRYVLEESPGGFGVLNTVASGARYLAERVGGPILVVEWGGPPESPTARLLEGLDATVVGVYTGDVVAGQAPSDEFVRIVSPRAGRASFLSALESGLSSVSHIRPSLILLSAGFDGMAGDPLGDLGLDARDYYEATRMVRGLADDCCDGRVLSILEGGYDARALGAATVQHLRALVGVAPID